MRKFGGPFRALFTSLLITSAGFGAAQTKTWTSTADFNEGIYFNTNASSVPGEVRLNRLGTAPVPFINVPVGGRELANRGWNYSPGRIVRIDTNSGKVVGEYRCVPNQFESAPSRAVVDSQGNVWMTTRYEGSGVHAITKIGIIIGGQRFFRPMPGIYIPHPLGEYVLDPDFTTGVDRDGDGYIRTSAGSGNYLPWNGTSGNDLDSSLPESAPGTVREAADELILVFKRFNGSPANGRCVAIDEDDNVWAGANLAGIEMWKLDGGDGSVVLKRNLSGGSYAYSAFYDQGFLWVSVYDFVKRVNVATGEVTVVSGANNGTIATVNPLDNNRIIACGNQNHSPPEVMIIDKATAAIVGRFSLPGSTDTRGMAIDQSGHIWVCSRGLWSGGNQRVYRYRPDGTLVNEFITGTRPCGIGLDSNGLMWVTHVGDPNTGDGAWTTVIDPNANGGTGAIVGYVGLGTGSYNYSDGTGATTSQIARDGEWRVTFDSFRPNLIWGTVSWTAQIPAQTGLEIYARAANTRLGLNGSNFVRINASGDDTNGAVVGRFIEMRARLSRDLGTSPDLTPALQSLTIRYAKGTVSGTVGLGNWLPEQYPNANFILRPVGGGNDLFVDDISLGPFGAFGFKTNARGSYYLFAKSSHWLQQVFPVPLNITDDGAHGNVFALLNGDVDGDNEITLVDYGQMAAAFGSIDGDPNWNPEADLDGDGEVNLGDLGILGANFGQAGDS